MKSTTARNAIFSAVQTFILGVITLAIYSATTLVGVLALSGVVAAQDLPAIVSTSLPQLPGVPGAGAKPRFIPPYESNASIPLQVIGSPALAIREAYSQPATSPATDRRVTLPEAQKLAEVASNPLVRLGQLQVEIAKQHREGVQAQYFPNISGDFYNNHLNKFPGEVLTLERPLTGGALSVPVNIVPKNQTAFNFTAVQPITPLFAVYQLVKIARADETIARAKAGMTVTETASKIEESYFDLLIAQRELISAQAEAKKIQSKWLRASSSAVTNISAEQEADIIAAEKVVAVPAGKVKELTASLNEMMGLPDGTTLELVPPEPLVEDISEKEAIGKAGESPAIVEAEQTSVKAHAGSKLSKMQYFPSVAIIGGYANQQLMNVILPRDFSYIGFMATYTVFDFGKREHGVKEASATAEAADLGVQLTKAKVESAVKTSYLELERSRQFALLARRMESAAAVVQASYKSDDPDVESAEAKMEADMFRAELEYRRAYAKLKNLMGEK